MTYSFDLINEPWIPCRTLHGERREFGLRELLVQAHELREVQGDTPLVTAAILRLLLALLHRVYGPASAAAWGELWRAGRWDPAPLNAYFARWGNRFDLFHPEHPFMQARDERVKPTPITAMIHTFVGGVAVPLFNHPSLAEQYPVSAALAARFLTCSLSFGFAGTKGPYMQFTDGIATRGILFFLEGRTLFETLLLNLLRYPDEQVMPTGPDDRPAWEVDDPFSPDREVPLGYLDYLTWPNRRILLIPEMGNDGLQVRQITMAPALRLSTSVFDPAKLYSKGGMLGWKVLRFNEDKALWRDSSALFRLQRGEVQHEGAHRPPAALEWLYALALGAHPVLSPQELVEMRRLLALGMANNQAKVDFFRQELLPLSPELLRDGELVDNLQELLDMAEGVRDQLWGAASTLASRLLVPAEGEDAPEPSKDARNAMYEQWAVERDYWSRLEVPFFQAMRDLADDPEAAENSWSTTLRRTAWLALGRVTRDLDESAAGLKAVVRAEDQLSMGLAKVLPKTMPARTQPAAE